MRINAAVETTLVVALLITLFASNAFAQGTSDPTNQQIHRGNITIGVGIASVAAGVFLLTPGQTSAARSEQNHNDVLAAGLVGTGFVLITWGAWQRQHKTSPQTKVGVTVGNRTAIQFVRRW